MGRSLVLWAQRPRRRRCGRRQERCAVKEADDLNRVPRPAGVFSPLYSINGRTWNFSSHLFSYKGSAPACRVLSPLCKRSRRFCICRCAEKNIREDAYFITGCFFRHRHGSVAGRFHRLKAISAFVSGFSSSGERFRTILRPFSNPEAPRAWRPSEGAMVTAAQFFSRLSVGGYP